MTEINRVEIPERSTFRIGDVADLIGVKPYVLRYWETEFPLISPQKSASGQRVYCKKDVEIVVMIKRLLYDERYSIEGARKRIRELSNQEEVGGSSVENSQETLSTVQVAPTTGLQNSESMAVLRCLVSKLNRLADVPIETLFRF